MMANYHAALAGGGIAAEWPCPGTAKGCHVGATLEKLKTDFFIYPKHRDLASGSLMTLRNNIPTGKAQFTAA